MGGERRARGSFWLSSMAQQILETLFDSPVKVKLLKLFLRNPDKYFHQKEIIRKTQVESYVTVNQLNGLFDIGFLKKRILNKKKGDQQSGVYYSVNPEFDFYAELRNLVLKSSPASKEKILTRVQKLGRIRLLLLSGIFLNTDNSRIDLFIVGDQMNHTKMNRFFKDLESEVGKEIAYATMTSKEFYYRFHMFDRFVHDILEKPNEKMINKLRI